MLDFCHQVSTYIKNVNNQIDKMHYTIAICDTMSGRSRSIFMEKRFSILQNYIHFDFLLYLEFRRPW